MARFLSPDTKELLPDWRRFVDRYAVVYREAKEQHTRAIEEYAQAEEAIDERPEIQQLDEAYAGAEECLGNIEHEITATRATSVAGLQVKWRFAERLLSDDEGAFENRLFRSIYDDAVQNMAGSVS